MAEIGGANVAASTNETEGGGPVSSSNADNTPQNVPASAPPISVNNYSTQQLSTNTSSTNGASNGLTSEQRRKLIAEVEQQRTEQRRLQLIESQKRAEAQREKQKEERKRRIEETRQREEARQRRAHETKKEIERQYKDHMQTLLQRNRDRTANISEQLRQTPNIMRASHIPSKPNTVVSSANGDRMATSFTVAFGSSAPRSICTRANEAVLRSQTAFEARLASYLNGRHSGCFLTQSSLYTTYALYVKPDLLPEDHPIRKHHQQLVFEHQHSVLNTPRRAVSANPAIRIAKKTTISAGSGSGDACMRMERHTLVFPIPHRCHLNPVLYLSSPSIIILTSSRPIRVVDENRSRAVSATRQQPLQHHCLRPTDRQAAGQASLPTLRRATSSQHFAEPTIAYASKVRGVPIPELPVHVICKLDASRSDDASLKRRAVPGRSNIPRDRCNSYAAPTTASMNRQRAPSHDQKLPNGEDRVSLTTLSTLPRRRPSVPTTVTTANQGRGRSQVREHATAKTQSTEASMMKPTIAKLSKPVPIKKPPLPRADQAKPIDPPPKSQFPVPAQGSAQRMDCSRGLAAQFQDLKMGLSPPVQTRLELDLAGASTAVDDVEETSRVSFTDEPENTSQTTEVENFARVKEERGVTRSSVAEEFNNVVVGTKNGVEVKASNAPDNAIPEADHEAAQEPASLGNDDIIEGIVQEKLQNSTLQLTSGPIKASTTGSGEGGCLPEEEAAIYRAKMAEQRRLAKERLAEQERREAEEERERKQRREAGRQAAIQAARERAIEEARLAAEARVAREAAEQEARLHAEREAQERAAKERQRLEAIERERLENFRKAEEERAMRKKRLDSIMSRVNRSDRSLSRGVTSSESSNSLIGAASGVASIITSTASEAKPAVQFSLDPIISEQLNVFQREPADSSAVPNHNSFPKTSGTHFASPLLQSFFGGGAVGSGSRLTGAFTHTSATSPSSSALTDDDVLSKNRRSDETQQPPSTTNLPMSTVESASNNGLLKSSEIQTSNLIRFDNLASYILRCHRFSSLFAVSLPFLLMLANTTPVLPLCRLS
ncbi:Ensconsin Microtubule associated protein 7 [Echinococcus multilocularis]|uniref:Ensconsin Microtubule associated protein 7 n=1 Tax=Echinococcus multilocularis TaxID=6211 RepID=A0A068YA77_ECHMU|nr:Ensconsin Microtubule associated protein 7 [Echinococcus multilocularis]